MHSLYLYTFLSLQIIFICTMSTHLFMYFCVCHVPWCMTVYLKFIAHQIPTPNPKYLYIKIKYIFRSPNNKILRSPAGIFFIVLHKYIEQSSSAHSLLSVHLLSIPLTPCMLFSLLPYSSTNLELQSLP